MDEKEERRIADVVLDRIRGGPLKRMIHLADGAHMSVTEFLAATKRFVDTGKQIDSFEDPEDLARFWADYELLTGDVVPSNMRQENPIECCA